MTKVKGLLSAFSCAGTVDIMLDKVAWKNYLQISKFIFVLKQELNYLSYRKKH